MRQFAMGAMYAIPAGANPTPVPIAILKDATVEYKQTKKELRGQWKAPIDMGEGPLDISIKVKNADFRASLLAAVIAGTTTTTGSVLVVTGESWAIPTTPFQVTVAQSAFFSEDGGVLDLTSGKWLTRVASAPTTGQYSVAAGVYTFAAADVGHNLSITYSYTSASVGSTVTYLNQTMGASVGFGVRLYNLFTVSGVTRPLGFFFPAVHFEKLSFALKAEDWTELDVEGKVVQDTTSQTVFKFYAGE